MGLIEGSPAPKRRLVPPFLFQNVNISSQQAKFEWKPTARSVSEKWTEIARPILKEEKVTETV